ncbi:cytochrome P450 [Rhizorhabdus dicambivorans]|nr:cytochrome P450 [Rhizorhabdus dicambivorans]
MSAPSPTSAAPRCPFVQGVAFDPFLPEQAGEPYSWLEAARESRPVFYWPQHDLWCVTRYDDINAIMRDPANFSNRKTINFQNMSDEFAAAFPEGRPDRVLVTLDPPEHGRLRRLAQAAFSPKLIESHRLQVRATCQALLAEFETGGQGDLVAGYADRLPVQIITQLIGAPPERASFFRQWALDRLIMLKGAPDFSASEREALIARAIEFNRWLADFVEERRDRPCDDMASALVHARTAEGDSALTIQEILGLIATIVSAGSTSTAHLIAMMFRELLTNRDQWEELIHDRSLVKNAIEETLRIRTPVHGVLRTTTREVEIRGVTIPAEADVYLYYASAQRDTDIFVDPDRFDIHRHDVARHMAFGRFVHVCLGASLARLEAEETLNAFLDRLPQLSLVEDQRSEWTPNILSPGLKALLVRW